MGKLGVHKPSTLRLNAFCIVIQIEEDVNKLELVSFKYLSNNLQVVPEDNVKQLISDQHYFYEMCMSL